MKIFIYLLLITGTSVLALQASDSVVSYKKPVDISYDIDGFPDSLWFGVAAKGAKKLFFVDTARAVFPDSLSRAVYDTPADKGMTIMSFWDDDYIYVGFMFDLERYKIYYDSMFCKIDMSDFWIDQTPWDPSTYQTYFNGGTDKNPYIGTGAFTRRFLSSIDADRIANHATNNFFKIKNDSLIKDNSLGSDPAFNFKIVSDDSAAYSLSYFGVMYTVFLEFKIPWEKAVISDGYPNAIYLNFGFLESQQSWPRDYRKVGDCDTLVPIKHYWAAQKPNAITPETSKDAWGKLVISREELTPRNESEQNVFPGEFIQGHYTQNAPVIKSIKAPNAVRSKAYLHLDNSEVAPGSKSYHINGARGPEETKRNGLSVEILVE